MGKQQVKANIKALHSQRGIIKASLTRFKTFLSKLDENNVDINLLKVKLEKIEPLWDKFNEVQTEIELLDPTDDEEIAEREWFEDEFCVLVSKARDIMDKRLAYDKEDSQSIKSNDSVSHRCMVELPKINLPTFDGKWEEFRSFKEEFNSLIDSRTDLAPIHKFRYLIRALKGDAALAIKAMEVSNDNYKQAWEALDERFDSKRRIVNKHVKAILDVENVEKAQPHKLQNLINTVSSHLRSLKSMGFPTDQWDALLVQIITRKLDSDTRLRWEQVGNKNEVPSMTQLMTFLQERKDVMEALNEGNPHSTSQDSQKRTPWKSRSLVTGNQLQPNKKSFSSTEPCDYCGKAHRIFACYSFRNLAVPTRILEIKRLGLCENCFKKGHSRDKCQGLSCRKCSKYHNTLLHLEDAEKMEHKKVVENESISRNAFSYSSKKPRPMILLSTAIVHVLNKNGKAIECRVLLDSGSQSNFVSENLAKQLSMPEYNRRLTVSGIGGNITEPLNSIRCSIKSRYEQFELDLECLVLPRITLPLPEVQVNISSWKIPKDIFLADPKFYCPGNIDMLIGAEQFYNIVKWQQLPLGSNLPKLQNTTFGWVIVGQVKESFKQISRTYQVTQCGCSCLIEENLKKFWDIEEVSTQSVLSLEEKACERSFEETTKRDETGRFIVNLPVKENIKQLGDSEEMALKRFYHLENRLNKDKALKTAYCSFMKEYLYLDHMKLAEVIDVRNPVYYLPHHCVVNAHSSTTNLRVVFDASAKTTTGLSLNEVLMVGPTIQQDLFSIVLRFRQHRYVITADITKMYRQIKVAEDFTNLQLIFWRDNPENPLKKYRLTTVTYGTAPASYLATRCLKQAALDEMENLPKGSAIIVRDFYMDDLLHGKDSLEELVTAKEEVIKILNKAGFHLHKWCSNEPTILANIPKEQREKKYVPDQANSSVKALGIWWNPSQDCLNFAINLPENKNATKRGVLSEAARLFDPLGLVGPIIVKAQIFLQSLWASGMNWDEPLSATQEQDWSKFREELVMLENIPIPRAVRRDWHSDVELHGFCDASERAYGAALYVRTQNSASYGFSQLLCAKSRVAPLKRLTLPRLELCGALLLSRLVDKAQRALSLSFSRKILWSDSTIVLAWLHSPSSRWRTFVANRVSEIQELTMTFEWRHVESADNPADKISRGLFPSEIIDDNLWWHGPSWLSQDSTFYPQKSKVEQVTEEQRPQICVSTVSTPPLLEWERYGSFTKLVRIVTYIEKFINIKTRKDTASSNCITCKEWTHAEQTVIKMVQKEAFSKEIDDLERCQILKKSSKIRNLCPFLDQRRLLRVGGRISNAQIPYNHKHPILLPDKHWITTLILRWEHIRHLHAGPQSLLAAVRRKFWPINGKSIARKIVRACIICARCNPKEVSQIMGELPKERLNSQRAFLNTGVDYCGPILIKISNHRNAKAAKAYVAIFVCLAIKAVHIELVSDLTTEAFLGALKRFFARRGKAKIMYSDNGTNFIGAQRTLHKDFLLAMQETRITNYLAEENIEWKFIPPRAPQFGGLWEAAVKAFKFHFKRVVGQALLTYEEMATFVALIEASLNSRPLCPLNSDPNDLSFLTPGHFLVGDAITAIPQDETTSQKISTLTRWRRVEHMFRQFWNRWSKEYLSLLQIRNKWQAQQPNLQIGQLVLMQEENLPPLKWPLARIIATHPGDDKMVRVVTLKTATGIFKRPISKVCLLPMGGDPDHMKADCKDAL